MNSTFNEFAPQTLPHSRSALGMVVVAHVAAALLLVQLFEARRYVEPMPLLVSLLSAPPSTEIASTPPVQPPERIREAPREPEPVPLPEPSSPVKFEPAPVPPPKPAPVQTLPEPFPEKIIEPAPVPPAPEPLPRAITEVPVPPPAPEPIGAAVPEPPSVSAPPPVAVASPIPPLPREPLPIIEAEPAPQPAITAPEQVQPPGDVTMTAEMLTAIYLSNPKPGYPNVSRRLREQGTVLLRVFVTVAGDPHKVELKSSSGFPRLDRAAHDAVQRWKFVPAKRGGEPVDAWVVVPIKFSLKG